MLTLIFSLPIQLAVAWFAGALVVEDFALSQGANWIIVSAACASAFWIAGVICSEFAMSKDLQLTRRLVTGLGTALLCAAAYVYLVPVVPGAGDMVKSLPILTAPLIGAAIGYLLGGVGRLPEMGVKS